MQYIVQLRSPNEDRTTTEKVQSSDHDLGPIYAKDRHRRQTYVRQHRHLMLPPIRGGSIINVAEIFFRTLHSVCGDDIALIRQCGLTRADLKEPLKIPIPKFDRSQQKLSAAATSPVRSSGRLTGQQGQTATAAVSATAAALKSPAKTSLALPLHPLSKPALMHPSLTAAASGGGTKRKSTSSRREELLMQLKAVEDAIAKKRSKMQ